MKEEYITQFQTLENFSSSNDALLKRQRGHAFEKLINTLLSEENILVRKSYHTKDNRSEQIDSAIEIDCRVLLVETKWVESHLAASDLFAFIGKIENKFFGTLGVFISRVQLSENFINALTRGRKQTVIVIHGNDIDNIFALNNNFYFKEYLKASITRCSIDNISHYPVNDYLKDIELNELEKPGNFNDKAITFIREKLKNDISEEDLLLDIESNGEMLNDKIFETVLEIYSKIYRLSFKNIDFSTIKNFNDFLKIYHPDADKIAEIAPKYYSIYLERDFEAYSKDRFVELFSNFYENLLPEKKHITEKYLAEKLRIFVKENNWNGENITTNVISPIWNNIVDKEIFLESYLVIYLRDTKEKFSQKKFANELVTKNYFDQNSIVNWFESKIIEIIKNMNPKRPSEKDIVFVSISYSKLNNIVKTENWVSFVKSLFFKQLERI